MLLQGTTLTLKQFMLRQQVISLYRNFFRAIRRLPERQRGELSDWVRADFKANKGVDNSDEETIKSLLLNGEKLLRELKQSVDLSDA
jgi:hypothetical protein